MSDAPSGALEACFAQSVNQTRLAHGLPALTEREDLDSLADQHSSQMAAAGHPFHNYDLPNQAPADWLAIGENVGRGRTCEAVTQALLASPPHRANILDPGYNQLGIGIVTSGGQIFVTEVFMKRMALVPRGPIRLQ